MILAIMILQSPLVKKSSKNTPTYGGSNTGLEIHPHDMKNIGNVPIIAPPNTNGINIIGFNIIGAPKSIGSLIPNKDGNNATCPIFR